MIPEASKEQIVLELRLENDWLKAELDRYTWEKLRTKSEAAIKEMEDELYTRQMVVGTPVTPSENDRLKADLAAAQSAAECVRQLEEMRQERILDGIGWGPTGWRVSVHFWSDVATCRVYRDCHGDTLQAAVAAAYAEFTKKEHADVD